MPKPTKATENPFNAKPEGLCADGEKAYAAIMALLTAEGATDTGGCQTFYSPAEWKERGEQYGTESVLIVVYDGGAVPPYFSLDADYPRYKRHTKMGEALSGAGVWAEECTNWYAAIYKE